MKTYFLTLSLFFGCCFFVFAQEADVQYKVTKEYDKNGNLIRYDSIKTQKNKWVSSNYSFNFNQDDLDSLLNGLDHIGTKMGIFLSDSISHKIDQVFKDKNFHIWMDDFEDNGFYLKLDDMEMDLDSLESHARIKMHHFRAKNDSVIEQHLEKELKRIQKKLEKIKAKRKTQ